MGTCIGVVAQPNFTPENIWLLLIVLSIFKSSSPRIVSGFFIAMRIDRVKYTAHYDEFGVLKDQWIGMEAEIDDMEDAKKQLSAIKELTDSWYKSNTPPFLAPPAPYDGNSFPGPRIIEKSPEERQVGLTPELIMGCEDIVTLQTFYPLIFKLTKSDDDLKNAYNKRKDELVAKETKEILDATNALTVATVEGHKLLDGFNKNTKIKK